MAISTDSWEDLAWRQEGMATGLLFLSDPEMGIIRTYGLAHETLGKDVARPASFLVDRDRVVTWRHLPEDWRHRMGSEAYLEVFPEANR